MTLSTAGPLSHQEAWDLIPWSIIGRIAEDDQRRLENHLLACAECRRELTEQKNVRRAIRREKSNIEYAPQASLQKLMARIDAAETAPPVEADEHVASNAQATERRVESTPWRRWLMAAATLLAVGTGTLLYGPGPPASQEGPARFRTVTSPPAQPLRAGQIRAVFAPNLTVEELTSIASETRLTIVDGPSDSGVYTLDVQPGTGQSIGDLIEALRSDPRVRFAEPVVADSR
jgi:hypothetical protein